MVVIVVVGFWPTYFGPAFRGSFPNPLIVDVHAIVFIGWMALLATQIALARRGRLQGHRRVGVWGIAYGFLVMALGITVGIRTAVLHVRAGEFTPEEMAAFLLVPFVDVVLFATFFLAAIAQRRKPEAHKRLMIVATNALIGPAVVRMTFLGQLLPLALVVGWSPIIIGMVHDWRVRGRVHVVYVVGLVAFLAGSLRGAILTSEAWLSIGRRILELFA
jgi:hypothetical protein